MFFIEKTNFPVDRWRDITYGIIVMDYRPEKSDTYHTRLTVGGDRVNYPGGCGTPTVDLTTVKILLDSIVLTPNVIVLRRYGQVHATQIMNEGKCNKAVTVQMTHRPNGQMTGQTKTSMLSNIDNK